MEKITLPKTEEEWEAWEAEESRKDEEFLDRLFREDPEKYNRYGEILAECDPNFDLKSFKEALRILFPIPAEDCQVP